MECRLCPINQKSRFVNSHHDLRQAICHQSRSINCHHDLRRGHQWALPFHHHLRLTTHHHSSRTCCPRLRRLQLELRGRGKVLPLQSLVRQLRQLRSHRARRGPLGRHRNPVLPRNSPFRCSRLVSIHSKGGWTRIKPLTPLFSPLALRALTASRRRTHLGATRPTTDTPTRNTTSYACCVTNLLATTTLLAGPICGES